jgi:hypothetical protein
LPQAQRSQRMQAGATTNVEKTPADNFFLFDQPPQAALSFANLGFIDLFGKFCPIPAKGKMRFYTGQVCFIHVHHGHRSS